MTHEPPARVRLTLDLEQGADPIAGSIAHGQAPVERFAGWLELMAALERMSDSRSVSPPAARSAES